MTGMMRRGACGIVVATLLGPAAPCGARQPVLHGAMIEYGADVALPTQGSYRLETKMDLGTVILNDEFGHDLKTRGWSCGRPGNRA